MTVSKAEDIMTRGMNCLIEALGVVGAEKFIVAVKQEKFDYTEWQRGHFDAMTPEEFYADLRKYLEAHPEEFEKNPSRGDLNLRRRVFPVAARS